MANVREERAGDARKRTREARSPDGPPLCTNLRVKSARSGETAEPAARTPDLVTPVAHYREMETPESSAAEREIRETFSERLLAPYSLTKGAFPGERSSAKDVGGAEANEEPYRKEVGGAGVDKKTADWRLSHQLCYNVPTAPASSVCSFHPLKFTFEPNQPALPIEEWHCYSVKVQPTTNFMNGLTTIYGRDGRRYSFEGFALLSTWPLDEYPPCQFSRYNIQYTASLKPGNTVPQCSMSDITLFQQYLFDCLLEMHDLTKVLQHHCQHFCSVPRFIHYSRDNQLEMLPLSEVLNYLLQSFCPLEGQSFRGSKGTERRGRTSDLLVTNPLKKPSCLRMDKLNRDENGPAQVVHYCNVLEDGINKSEERQKKQALYLELHRKAIEGVLKRKEYFQHKDLKHTLRSHHCQNDHREIAVLLSAEGFFSTGLCVDVAQHSLLLSTLIHHVVFHKATSRLESLLQYSFKNKLLLQSALTHPSILVKMEDDLKVVLSNCGLRRPEYAKPAVVTQRKGLRGLLNLGASVEKDDDGGPIQLGHNERLEFLGDAVLEYLCSLHLFHLFSDYSVGQITDFRRALVKNRHLSTLAAKLHLLDYMLAAPSLDLCTEADFSHAGANCFEALLGGVFLDSGLEECQKLFGRLVFPEEDLYQVWKGYPVHPLQVEYPGGDRHMIGESEVLQKMVCLEQSVGVQFTHIRVLAKAFTHSSVGYTNLTRGDYQTMELLGDAILQLLATYYVYHHFPHHHEGHLSTLRMVLVSNKQLARVSSELGFGQYILTGRTENVSISNKMMADVVESFLAALVLDKGLTFARKFCEVCIFPKLADCSEGLNWLDAKSRLQHAVTHTCRVQKRPMETPQYRVVRSEGPANKRIHTVAVMFRGRRLGIGSGGSIQEADMAAAEEALKNKSGYIVLPDALKKS